MQRIVLDMTVAADAAVMPRTWISSEGTIAAVPIVTTDQGVPIEVGFAGTTENCPAAPFGGPAWRSAVTGGLRREGFEVEGIHVEGGGATIRVRLEAGADLSANPLYAAAVYAAAAAGHRRAATEMQNEAKAAVIAAHRSGTSRDQLLTATGLTAKMLDRWIAADDMRADLSGRPGPK